jgi:hypothetical protein
MTPRPYEYEREEMVSDLVEVIARGEGIEGSIIRQGWWP